MINESPTRLRATSLSHLSRRCPEGKLLPRIYESREFFFPLVCFALFYCLTFFLERWWDECDSFRGLGEQNPTSCQATINRLSRIWPLKKFTKRSWFWPTWCSDSLRIPCLEFIKVSLYRLKWVRNSVARWFLVRKSCLEVVEPLESRDPTSILLNICIEMILV